MKPNPKIQELIKSLGIIPEDEHYEVADLIIKECITALREEKKSELYTQQINAGIQVSIATISNHFMV